VAARRSGRTASAPFASRSASTSAEEAGEEPGAQQLGGVDVGGDVTGGVDVAIGPVVEVERRHAEGAVAPHVVIAAAAVVGELGEQGLLPALGSVERPVGASRRGEGVGLAVDEGAERRRHVVHEGGQARRPAGDVKHRLGRRPAAHHVEVEDGLGARRDLRPLVQQRQRALHLVGKDEAQRARRPRQLAFLDQLGERARHFEDGGAAAGVVVGARARMVEVTAEGDLLAAARGVAAGKRGGDHLVRARVLAGAHLRRQPHRLAAREPRLEVARGGERDHEGEARHGVEAAEVAPADEGGVVPPPGRALVLDVADDAGGAVRLHGERDHRLRLGRHEHQLAAHVAAGVVGLGGAGADVDEVGLHLGALAVLRQGERHGVPARETARAAPVRRRASRSVVAAQLPELREVGVPGAARALGAVEGLAVGGDADDLDIAQAAAAQLAGDEFRRGGEAARAAHAVLTGEELEVALGRLAGELLNESASARLRQQGRGLGGQR